MVTKRRTNINPRALLKLMEWGLLGYTAYRTYDLVSMTLPENSFIVAGLALAGIDLAFLIWQHVYSSKATTDPNQKAIALTMIIVTGVGIAATLIGDTFYQASHRNPAIKADFSQLAIWIVVAAIMANLIAVAVFDMIHADNQAALDDQQLAYAPPPPPTPVYNWPSQPILTQAVQQDPAPALATGQQLQQPATVTATVANPN